ncbi:MAG: hypothetical protein Q7W55_12040 [Pseudohongiella sp.]|nr:hypothetical protein [Pseudohongiella sp.]MDO9519461.1 hypothetical protein [Pseudohongiella sp.]MDP2127531.1 hypothetical protein [Pseudohongiella sp.]
MKNQKSAISAGLMLVLMCVSAGLSGQPAATGNEGFDPVRTVNIVDEPRHRTVLRDGNLRLLDVQINPGDTTLPHTHDAAILYTFISNGEGTLNGRVSSVTSYVTEQYTHRVNNAGPGLFRIIALANYGEAIALVATDLPVPAMTAQLENEWFRSYRLELAPGESSARTTHTYPVAIVQVSEGLVHVSRADGITQELKAMGDWAWREAGIGYQIHNRSDATVSLVINEGKR